MLRYGGFVIGNNSAEHALCWIAVGWKGWKFFLNWGAGENAAILFSLILTVKAIGVNPVDSPCDVLVRLDFELDWGKPFRAAWKVHPAQEDPRSGGKT